MPSFGCLAKDIRPWNGTLPFISKKWTFSFYNLCCFRLCVVVVAGYDLKEFWQTFLSCPLVKNMRFQAVIITAERALKDFASYESDCDWWLSKYFLSLLVNTNNGWKTQDGRMTKKCRARLCIPGLSRHFFDIQPPRVFKPSWCVRPLCSLLNSKVCFGCQNVFRRGTKQNKWKISKARPSWLTRISLRFSGWLHRLQGGKYERKCAP